MANTDLSLQENTQKVLTANKIVNGRSVTEALADLTGLVSQLVKTTANNQSTYYVKGDKRPEVYALDVASGSLRHVGAAEFAVVTSINIFKVVEQAKVDALLKDAA